MEPNTKTFEDQTVRESSLQPSDQASIRILSRELSHDVQQLVKQHIALVKTETRSPLRKIGAGIGLSILAFLLVAFGLAAFAVFIGLALSNAFNWSDITTQFVNAILILLMASLLFLIGYLLLKNAKSNPNTVFEEIKEDWQWLQKIL